MKDLGKIRGLVCGIPLFWKLQICGWFVYAILTLPLKVVLYDSLAHALFVTLFRESFGFLVTSGLRTVYNKQGLNTDRPLVLVVSVLSISFLCSGLESALGLSLDGLLGGNTDGTPLFGIFVFRALLYTVWSLLFFTIREQLAARKRLAKLQKAELAARDAEILMLRAQVSPHFLFNAFNTILADLDGHNPELVPVVRGLSDYFRYSLANHDEVFVTMGQEYDAILSYLTVEKARFGDSLEIDCHLDSGFRDVQVPGIFLQPLVENALKFGHMTSPTPLVLGLLVTAAAEGGMVLVEVSNSGAWVEPAAKDSRVGTGGHGLSVLRRRLELLYPGNHSLEIVHTEEEGRVKVRILLPSQNPSQTSHAK